MVRISPRIVNKIQINRQNQNKNQKEKKQKNLFRKNLSVRINDIFNLYIQQQLLEFFFLSIIS